MVVCGGGVENVLVRCSAKRYVFSPGTHTAPTSFFGPASGSPASKIRMWTLIILASLVFFSLIHHYTKMPASSGYKPLENLKIKTQN